MKNFWQSLPRPFFALAPMDDVTDTVFRQIVASCGKPDVFFTEFVSCEGLCSPGRDRLLPKLKFSEKERPVVAQIWGSKPENFLQTAKLVKNLGFDGVDINMGCPDRSVMKAGGGGVMIKDPVLVKEVILAAKEGAGELPLSVKTRVGFDKIQIESWIGNLLELNLQALTIHGRTVKELSKVPAHWEEIGKAVQLRDQMKAETLIIGNGDVESYGDGLEKCKIFGVDGAMIGRGIFDNLWFFDSRVDPQKITSENQLKVLLEHAKLFEDTWGNSKNFAILKKFFKAYVRGFKGASKLRESLMETRSLQEIKEQLLRAGQL
ncbi:MAG: tRNA-dihydrouridine synthase [bacterium]|nr:tRNA-dihydrouridine synthase [bacterium]